MHDVCQGDEVIEAGGALAMFPKVDGGGGDAEMGGEGFESPLFMLAPRVDAAGEGPPHLPRLGGEGAVTFQDAAGGMFRLQPHGRGGKTRGWGNS